MKTFPAYFSLFDTCRMKFRTLEDLEAVKAFAADFFENDERIVKGIYELAINAVEHGNLGIGYQYKAELLAEMIWRDEIQKRLEHPDYKDKMAEITLARKDGGIYVIVTDAGNGFDWRGYLNIDPGRAGQQHGRGIAIARNLSFSKLSYNEQGNQAIGFIG